MKQIPRNKRFHKLIHAPRQGNRPLWTRDKIADEIYVSREHLSEVFNNKPGRGKQVRPKAVKFFKKHFPETWREILAALGWDEEGNIIGPGNVNVPRGTLDVEPFVGGGHG